MCKRKLCLSIMFINMNNCLLQEKKMCRQMCTILYVLILALTFPIISDHIQNVQLAYLSIVSIKKCEQHVNSFFVWVICEMCHCIVHSVQLVFTPQHTVYSPLFTCHTVSVTFCLLSLSLCIVVENKTSLLVVKSSVLSLLFCVVLCCFTSAVCVQNTFHLERADRVLQNRSSDRIHKPQQYTHRFLTF